MQIRKLGYYARALVSLLRSLENPTVVLPVLLYRERMLRFRSGLRLSINDPLQLLLCYEVCLSDEYQLHDLQQASRIIDVGAGAGEFAIMAARRFPDATVLAFEPQPQQFQLLRKNVVANGCGNIEIHQCAVGSGSIVIDDSGSRSVTRSSVAEADSSLSSVEAIRLSQFLSQPIDLLKIDCEGAELSILESLNSGEMTRVGEIALEFHDFLCPGHSQKLVKLLEKHGFFVEMRTNRYQPDLGHIFATKKTGNEQPFL